MHEKWRDEIIKGIIHAGIGIASGTIVIALGAYVTLSSMGATVSANEQAIKDIQNEFVRKDVLTEILQPMKESTIRIEAKLDRLIERELR